MFQAAETAGGLQAAHVDGRIAENFGGRAAERPRVKSVGELTARFGDDRHHRREVYVKAQHPENAAGDTAQGPGGGEIAVLLCDHPSAPVLERARRLGIDALCPPAGRFRTRLEDERPWLEAMHARAVGTVLLAGFMRRLHGTLLMAFPDRILNLHPSLLPAFPGLEAIRRAWEHGVRVTGCTVHLVTADVDGGPILAQDLSAFVITAICAHSLTYRPLVESAERVHVVRLGKGAEQALVVVDGQESVPLSAGQRAVIRKAPVSFGLVKVPGRSYYQTLRDKLRWGTTPKYRSEP